MIPVLVLLGFGLGTALCALVGLPRAGILPRLAAWRRMTERVRLDDLVRHLYEYQIEGHPCTLESIEGRIGVSRSTAEQLLSETESLGLVQRRADAVLLTDWGQEFAIRAVRSHRAWVRYSARRADLPRGRRRPVGASPARDDGAGPGRLDAPDLPGVSLFRVDVGEQLEVVAIASRSDEVEKGLASRGVAPGVRLTTVDRSDQMVQIRVGGEFVSLGQVAAQGVRVRRVREEASAPGEVVTLADLGAWEIGTVVQILPECRGAQRRRLLDLGIVPGAEVVPEMEAGAGDPVAFRISDALVALRLSQAAQVEVRPSSRAGMP